jgi:hypothetical protein
MVVWGIMSPGFGEGDYGASPVNTDKEAPGNPTKKADAVSTGFQPD